MCLSTVLSVLPGVFMPNCVIVIGFTFKTVCEKATIALKIFFLFGWKTRQKWETAQFGRSVDAAGKMLLNPHLTISEKMEVDYLASIECWGTQWRRQSAKSCHRLLNSVFRGALWNWLLNSTNHQLGLSDCSLWWKVTRWHSTRPTVGFSAEVCVKAQTLKQRTRRMTHSRTPTEPKGTTSVSPTTGSWQSQWESFHYFWFNQAVHRRVSLFPMAKHCCPSIVSLQALFKSTTLSKLDKMQEVTIQHRPARCWEVSVTGLESRL